MILIASHLASQCIKNLIAELIINRVIKLITI
jgi:hypothetical protein